MQATHKEIYEKVANERNISYEMVKTVGDCVFKAWNYNLKNPRSIILKIKKIGRMYLRKNKMERIVSRPPSIYNIEENQAIRENYTERLKEYELFLQKKREVQTLRRETQPLIPKIEDELD